MMMKHATWSEFPELAHELYHPGVRAVAQEETPEVVTTLVDATLEEQMPE